MQCQLCLATISAYCKHRNFRTRFNFVYFVLLAESTKFSSIRKPCTYTSVRDTVLAVRKFIAYKSSRTLGFEIFTQTKISAITLSAAGCRSPRCHNSVAKPFSPICVLLDLCFPYFSLVLRILTPIFPQQTNQFGKALYPTLSGNARTYI